jgi:hypothetical protein
MMSDERPPAISDAARAESAEAPMGTLVIRTWGEPNQLPGFRARLTYGHDLNNPTKTFSTADPEEALSFVRQWLFDQPGARDDVP